MNITADRRRDLLLYVENQILDAKDSATQAVYADLRAMVQGDADRARLSAEVLRMTDAVMESDARGAEMKIHCGNLKIVVHNLCCASGLVIGRFRQGRIDLEDAVEELATDCAEAHEIYMRVAAALSPATSTGSEVGK